MHSEFGTDNVDEVIKKILQSGTVQTMEVSKPPSVPLHTCTIREPAADTLPHQMPSRQGVTNDSMSSMRSK
jgi:hypothetical protein